MQRCRRYRDRDGDNIIKMYDEQKLTADEVREIILWLRLCGEQIKKDAGSAGE